MEILHMLSNTTLNIIILVKYHFVDTCVKIKCNMKTIMIFTCLFRCFLTKH